MRDKPGDQGVGLHASPQHDLLRDPPVSEPLGDSQVESKAAAYKVIEFNACDLPPSYRNLIYAKWLRSLRYGSSVFRLMDPAAYYPAYNKFIARILSGASPIRLAVLADDDDVVLGFCVYRGEILDYVHVHRDMRKLGIMRKLIPPGITTFTHLTNVWQRLWKLYYADWKFNPFV